MNVLVTGASGFIGRALCAELARREIGCRAVVRDLARAPAGVPAVLVPRQDAGTDWSTALAGVDALVCLAARAHRLPGDAGEALEAHRAAEQVPTLALARQAAQRGVRRLVYVSSIKVNGESTDGRAAFAETDPPAPQDAYARCKLETERALRDVASADGLELCILRPALVYGPGVKGNLARLLEALWRGWPLPFGALANQRSLVGLASLCRALLLCLQHPAAAGELFLAADAEALSTAQICRLLAQGLGRPARLWPAPPALLRLAALAGRGAEVRRLCGSLSVDAGRLQERLAWAPSPAAAGLVETGAAYRRWRQAQG